MKQTDLPPLVLSGKLDRILDALSEACNERRRVLREQRKAQNLAELTPGTRVRIVNIKPRYLEGMTGEVLTRIPSADFSPRFRGTLPVKLDHPSEARRFGPVINVPASALERC